MPERLQAIISGFKVEDEQVPLIDSEVYRFAPEEPSAIPTEGIQTESLNLLGDEGATAGLTPTDTLGASDSRIPAPIIDGGALGISLYSNPDWVSNRNQELNSIRAQDEQKGYWDGLGIAIENEWFTSSMSRVVERSGREIDPNWEIGEEQLADVTVSYKKQEQQYLLESQSETEYIARKADIVEDRTRNAKALEHGILPTLTMAILDPAGIVLSLATAGGGLVAKSSRIQNALRLATLTSAETAVLEYSLLQGDTQKTMQDVFFSGAIGFGLGAGLGSLRKTAKTQEMLDADDKFSSAVRERANQDIYAKERDELVYKQHRLKSDEQVLDGVQFKLLDMAQLATGRLLSPTRVEGLNRVIAKGKETVANLKTSKETAIQRELDLQSPRGEDKIISRADKKSINKEVIKAKETKGKLLSDKQEELTEFWAKRGVAPTKTLDLVTKDQAARIAKKYDDPIAELEVKIEEGNYRLNASDRAKASKNSRTKKNEERELAKRQAAVDKIASNYDQQIDGLLSRLDGYQTRLDNDVELGTSKAELDDLHSMTKEEQVNHFFPERTPEELEELSSINSRLEELYSLGVKQLDELAVKYIPEVEGEGIGDSVGAMRTKATGTLFPDENIMETDRVVIDAMIERYIAYETIKGRNWSRLPDWLLSDYTKANQSESLEILALNHLLRDNPQAGDAHTAATLISINDHNLRYAGQNSMDSGFEVYLNEQGIGAVQGYLRSEHRITFEKDVALAIKGIGEEGRLTPSVLRARDGMRNLFKEALAMRKKFGEKGFTEIEADPNYLPDIMDSALVNNLRDLNWDKANVVDLLKEGYYRGANKLSHKQARVVAEIKYNSISKNWLATDDAVNVFRADNIADATDLLKKANVSQELIDDFFEDIFTESDFKSVSKRARKTLKIDWEAKHTFNGSTVKISDIMTTNVSKLSEAYTIESAFGAGMAELGIKSEGQLQRIINRVGESAANAGGDSAKQAKQHMEDIFKTLTQLRGRPVVDYKSKFNKAGRMILDTTAMLRLQQVGFASIPEFARSLTEIGVAETLRNITSSGMFRMPSFKAGHVRGRDESMKLYNEEMQDVEEMIGTFIGEPELGRNFNMREADLGSEADGRFTGLLDRALEGGRRIGSVVSLHQMIQGGLGKVIANGTNRALLKGALGTRTMSRSMRNQLRMTGMKDERWAEISKWVKDNPATKDFEGRKIDVWNHDKMPDDIRRDIQVTMNRLLDRSVQKANVGELNVSWLGAMGRYITQFRTFSLISLEKQLVADMRGDAMSMPAKFMYGTGLAAASYYSQMNIRAIALPEDKREEYLEKQLTGANLYWGIFNKHSMLAAAGLFNEAAIATGIAPKEAYDSTRYGYLNSNVDAAIPSLGLVNDVASLTGSSFDVVAAATYRDEDVEEAGKKAAKDLIKLTPYAQTIGIGEYIKNLTEE